MTHRAETIMTTIVNGLTGLATTGQRVYRGRFDNIPALPALSVFMGRESQVETQSFNVMRRELEVEIQITVQGLYNLETSINQIRAEVYAALMADVTQGRSFIINTTWREDTAPEFSPEQDQGIARVVMTWAILYSHSLTSAES